MTSLAMVKLEMSLNNSIEMI